MMLDRRRELVAGGRRWESDMHLGIVAEGTGGLRACPRQGGPPGAVERDLQETKGPTAPLHHAGHASRPLPHMPFASAENEILFNRLM